MNLILSIDDYSEGNVELAKIIKNYGLEKNTIFFIDFRDSEGAEKQIVKLDKMEFRIGGHTLSHPQDLKIVPRELVRAEIINCKAYIDDLIKRSVEWFCYPRGRYNEGILEIVEKAGFKYGRTTKVFDIHKAEDPYQTGTAIHMFERDEYDGADWLEVAKFTFDECRNHKCNKEHIYHIWGHAFELLRPGELDKFKEILKYISNGIYRD